MTIDTSSFYIEGKALTASADGVEKPTVEAKYTLQERRSKPCTYLNTEVLVLCHVDGLMVLTLHNQPQMCVKYKVNLVTNCSKDQEIITQTNNMEYKQRKIH